MRKLKASPIRYLALSGALMWVATRTKPVFWCDFNLKYADRIHGICWKNPVHDGISNNDPFGSSKHKYRLNKSLTRNCFMILCLVYLSFKKFHHNKMCWSKNEQIFYIQQEKRLLSNKIYVQNAKLIAWSHSFLTKAAQS